MNYRTIFLTLSLLAAVLTVGPGSSGCNPFPAGADPRWSDDDLGMLKTIKGFNFEVVKMGTVITK
jgi:hypothetical protein